MDIEIFKPNVKDIELMQSIVEDDVENGNILQRSSSEMATTIRSYIAIKYEGSIVAFVALHIHTVVLAEIRSLIVHKEYRNKGLGQILIKEAIKEAKDLLIDQVLVLTYQQKLFEKFDFKVIEKSILPEPKIWADCIKCKHFPICDEIALLLDLKERSDG